LEFPRPPRRDVRIDTSALIDVVFLLLIFFAVSTTFLESSGLDLELPSAETSAAPEPRDVTVWIGAEGNLRFDGRDLQLADLEGDLRTALEQAERKFVVIMADRDARLEHVVQVMDLARKSGAVGLSIASEEP
jgi:biopolymer transport protein ExbD